jgi:hypothetical protein
VRLVAGRLEGGVKVELRGHERKLTAALSAQRNDAVASDQRPVKGTVVTTCLLFLSVGRWRCTPVFSSS